MNIYEKLQGARVELQALELKKSGENKFAKFNYFELGDFLPSINIIFNKYQLCTNFSISNENACLIIINGEKPDETIVYTSPIASADVKGCTPIQSLGATHTYMKRYLYLNALEIVEADILDPLVGKDDKKNPPNNNTPPAAPDNFQSTDNLPFSEEFGECCECHKQMPEKFVKQSEGKYGLPFCSKACLDKHELRQAAINSNAG